jgi:hypothetical protein
MKRFGTICFYILALGISATAVYTYGFMPLGSRLPPDMKLNFLAHKAGIYTHVFAAAVALSLSPFQFSTRLRSSRPRLHRILGRAYLGIGVTLGGLSGLYMSAHAHGGMVARSGFACLALGWLFTGLRAFQSIRRGAVDEHRTWVVRNVSLTLAAVTLRLYLPASMIAGISFDVAYPVIAWLCWVPNLIVAELVFNAGRSGDTLKAKALRDAA